MSSFYDAEKKMTVSQRKMREKIRMIRQTRTIIYLPSRSRVARESLLLFLNLCFFILLRRFLFVLSASICTPSTAGTSVSACKPSRASVCSQLTVFPTLFTTNARDSCRAASASASGDASGGSSIVPNEADGASSPGIAFAVGRDSNSFPTGWLRRR